MQKNLTHIIRQTPERWEEIERQRQAVYADPGFQKWARQMGVGRLHREQDGRIRAREMMSEWGLNFM